MSDSTPFFVVFCLLFALAETEARTSVCIHEEMFRDIWLFLCMFFYRN